MCGRYVQVSSIAVLEQRFQAEVKTPERWSPTANAAPGDQLPVILGDSPQEIVFQRFGLSPQGSKPASLYINARSETALDKPSFRLSMRKKRCIIPVDAFYEGPDNEKLSKPYLVYLMNKERPFAFAGIWDEWNHPITGEIARSFAILTTGPNRVMKAIGHSRCPAILQPEEEALWLSPHTSLADAMALLRPCADNRMNAYPVSPAMKNARLKGVELVQPQGERLFEEAEYITKQGLALRGMGRRNA